MENQQKIILLITIGCITMLLMAAIVILFVSLYKRNMLQKENQIKIMQQEKQIELFKAAAEAEEKQKEKIARNLHDEINPLLSALKFNLARYRIQAAKNTFEPENLKQDENIIDKAIEGIRTTCHDLIPSFLLDYGLLHSLESYIQHLNGVNGLSTDYRSTFEAKELTHFEKQDELHIYRVCMEILNNILKHSQCSTLTLQLDKSPDLLKIEFNHNGKGITNNEIEQFTESSKGLGLKSLKARTLLLNADINYIKEEPNAKVILSIPHRS